jgi:hypothetical protein
MKGKVFAFVLLTALRFTTLAVPVAMDFTNWTSRAIVSPYPAEWLVQNEGTQVTQTQNCYPGVFVSTDSYINKIFRGTIKVNTELDDDFFGLVFGYKDPVEGKADDMYVIDWKKEDGNIPCYKGITLARLDGTITNANDLWNRSLTNSNGSYQHLIGKENPDPVYNSTGSWTTWGNVSWEYNTEYSFEVLYQQNRLAVKINNNTLIDMTGTFQAGKFGLYNFSQGNAQYYNFTVEDAPVPEPATICLLAFGGLAVLRGKCLRCLN